jgi:hypothetical protein
MMADRKKDAREKFLLGGIVVKAGLSKADRAFLLGGLHRTGARTRRIARTSSAESGDGVPTDRMKTPKRRIQGARLRLREGQRRLKRQQEESRSWR